MVKITAQFVVNDKKTTRNFDGGLVGNTADIRGFINSYKELLDNAQIVKAHYITYTKTEVNF